MRCFVAIELSDEVRKRLAHLQGQLQSLGKAVRWTPPEQIHLTMKFLGDVADGDVTRVAEAAREVAGRYPPMDLEVCGAGIFPPRGAARIVWAGVADPPAELLSCQRDCEAVCADLGFEPEHRAYTPHLTVGRVKEFGASDRIRETMRQFASFRAGAFTARELVLFQSDLRPSGAVYTPLARAPFKT